MEVGHAVFLAVLITAVVMYAWLSWPVKKKAKGKSCPRVSANNIPQPEAKKAAAKKRKRTQKK